MVTHRQWSKRPARPKIGLKVLEKRAKAAGKDKDKDLTRNVWMRKKPSHSAEKATHDSRVLVQLQREGNHRRVHLPLPLLLPLPLPHAHTQARTHTHARTNARPLQGFPQGRHSLGVNARAHAHTHTHTHTHAHTANELPLRVV